MFDLVKDMIEKIFGGGATKSVADSVFINTSSADFQSVWNTVETIYENFLVPFGICILLFMFFYSLLDKMATTEVSFEVIGKMLCKLFLLFALMETALTLANGIVIFADKIIHILPNAVNLRQVNCIFCGLKQATAEYCSSCGGKLPGSNVVGTVVKVFYGTSNPSWDGWLAGIEEALDSVVPLLALVLPWLVTIICEVLIKIIVLTREIEIYARAAFMPVALGDSYNGLTSGGARYVKSFLAVCLQGALIVVIMLLADSMSEAYLVNVSANGSGLDKAMGLVIMPIVYRIASVGLILKSMPLAKEICGTN